MRRRQNGFQLLRHEQAHITAVKPEGIHPVFLHVPSQAFDFPAERRRIRRNAVFLRLNQRHLRFRVARSPP